MNTTFEQSIGPIISEAPLVSDATSDQKVRHSKGIPSTFLPQALKPHNKISRKKKKLKRRYQEVFHFDSDEEEELDLD